MGEPQGGLGVAMACLVGFRVLLCILPTDVRTSTFRQLMDFPLNHTIIKLLAGEQKATEELV